MISSAKREELRDLLECIAWRQGRGPLQRILTSWRCLRCDAQLPLAGGVVYYVSRRGKRWPLHRQCLEPDWVPCDGGWTFPTNILVVEQERLVWGCGCWRDLRGTLHKRPQGCTYIHHPSSRWPRFPN